MACHRGGGQPRPAEVQRKSKQWPTEVPGIGRTGELLSLRRIYAHALGEFRAYCEQFALGEGRVRMCGAEDPPSPLDHVLQYAVGF